MADIYEQGDGVARDNDQSIEWERKYVSLLQKQKINDPQCEKIITALIALGEKLIKIGQIQPAKAAFQAAQSYIGHFSAEYSEEDRADWKIWAMEEIAALYDSCGDRLDAIERFDDLEKMVSPLYEKNPYRWEERFADIHVNLGKLCWNEGWLDFAEKYLNQALYLFLNLAKRTGSSDFRRRVAGTFFDLGMVARLQNELTEAKEAFSKTLDISLQLYQELEQPDDERSLFVCYYWLGTICESEGKTENQFTYYKKCLEIAQSLKKKTETNQADKDLSSACLVMGRMALRENNLQDAESYCLESVKLRKSLSEKLKTYESLRDLSAVYAFAAEVYEEKGDLDNATLYSVNSLKILEDLYKHHPSDELHRKLARSWDRNAMLFYAKDDQEQTEQCLQIAYDYAKGVDNPENSLVILECTTTVYMHIGSFYRKSDPQKALKYLEEASVELEKYLAENPLKTRSDMLGECYYYLGELYYNQSQWEPAKDRLRSAVNILEQYLKKRYDTELYKELALSCFLLGEMGDKQMEKKAYDLADKIESKEC